MIPTAIDELHGFLAAEPFRPFRVFTRHEVCEVRDRRQVAVSASAHMVVIIADAARMLPLPAAEIVRCETSGDGEAVAPTIPDYLVDAARAVVGLGPDETDECGDAGPDTAPPADPGRVHAIEVPDDDGVFVVHATVCDATDRMLFDCTDTRWNVHGFETFENGTSLYLHHLDHPTVEQRIILWPGKNGTFDSFSEAVSFDSLNRELRSRDVRLHRRPARAKEPPKAWFRDIALEWPAPRAADKSAAFGEDPTEDDEGRFTLELERVEVGPGQWVQNPRIVDTRGDRVVFTLFGSPWDCEIGEVRSGAVWSFSLRFWPHADNWLRLSVDLRRMTAIIAGESRELPLGFVERHLHNFVLYEPWEAMVDSLRAGPHASDRPDLTLPLSDGYCVELWPGDARYPVPFLQPRFMDPQGRTVLDFRATTWAARVSEGASRPAVALRFVSHEREGAIEAAMHLVKIDLVSHRVVCPGLEGSTSLGMFQSFVRHVRGTKWMNEALPELLAKGRGLPAPSNER